MVSRGEGRGNRAAEPSLEEGRGLSCKEEEEKEVSQLQEVSGVWSGSSSSPPWRGCYQQTERVAMTSITNLARAQRPPTAHSWLMVPSRPQITL